MSKGLGLLLLAVVLSSPAYANIGLPMIFVVWPASWAALLLVIPLEAWVASRLLRFYWGDALLFALKTNLLSTLVGIPLTWLALVIPEALFLGGAFGIKTPAQRLVSVTLQSPWLIPYEGEMDWMVPAAAMSLCVSFFFMSVGVEGWVAKRLVDKEDHPVAKQWAWRANLLSYGFLLCALAIRLFLILRTRVPQ